MILIKLMEVHGDVSQPACPGPHFALQRLQLYYTTANLEKNLRHNAFGVTDEEINIVISDILMPIPALN